MRKLSTLCVLASALLLTKLVPGCGGSDKPANDVPAPDAEVFSFSFAEGDMVYEYTFRAGEKMKLLHGSFVLTAPNGEPVKVPEEEKTFAWGDRLRVNAGHRVIAMGLEDGFVFIRFDKNEISREGWVPGTTLKPLAMKERAPHEMGLGGTLVSLIAVLAGCFIGGVVLPLAALLGVRYFLGKEAAFGVLGLGVLGVLVIAAVALFGGSCGAVFFSLLLFIPIGIGFAIVKNT